MLSYIISFVFSFPYVRDCFFSQRDPFGVSQVKRKDIEIAGSIYDDKISPNTGNDDYNQRLLERPMAFIPLGINLKSQSNKYVYWLRHFAIIRYGIIW